MRGPVFRSATRSVDRNCDAMVKKIRTPVRNIGSFDELTNHLGEKNINLAKLNGPLLTLRVMESAAALESGTLYPGPSSSTAAIKLVLIIACRTRMIRRKAEHRVATCVRRSLMTIQRQTFGAPAPPAVPSPVHRNKRNPRMPTAPREPPRTIAAPMMPRDVRQLRDGPSDSSLAIGGSGDAVAGLKKGFDGLDEKLGVPGG